MKIYLATSNKDKRREMAELLAGHTVVIPADEGIDFNPIEDGKTFMENSIIKARALYDLVQSPVIADDSGICVDALGGEPGVYSARYAGPAAPHGNGCKISQAEQNAMLVAQLNDAISKGIGLPSYPNGERSAHYTCAMTLFLGRGRLFVAQETMEGAIVGSADEARGTGGFGYDPLFLLPALGKTAAELSPKQKNAISHRGKACMVISHIIECLAASGALV